MEYQFTINRRLFSEFFARHKDTFVAFCELVNNALQAQAKEIRINLTRSPADKLSETLFDSITIRDTGVGVSKSEFGWKILEIATDARTSGKLSYLGNVLQVKDRDVKEVFEKEFSDVPLGKLKSALDPSKNKF